jgi:magnesium transporter
MISRYSAHGLTWIDLVSPTADETAHIAEEFEIPSLVSQELIDHTLRSKVDMYPSFLYLVLHFPLIDADDKEQEVDFIVGEKFMITVRYEQMRAIDSFAKIFERHTLGTQMAMTAHGTFLFMQLIKLLYRSLLHQLETMTDELKHIESRIFTNNQVSIVRDISRASRKLLDFKQSTRFHAEVLASYESASKRLFGDEYVYYGEVVNGEYKKVASILESHRDVVAELQRTNDSLLSTKSNEIMKNFTIMTFVMLPLTLITGIFGMNTTSDLIFIKSIDSFFFVIGVMGITGLVLFLFFKLRRWI